MFEYIAAVHKLRVMDFELRHLRVIRAIADAGSVTRAATVLGTTQPALSAQLRRIEEHLGGTLFERSRHGVVTTGYGAQVLLHARAVLAEMGDLRRLRPSIVADNPVRIGGVSGPILVGWAERLETLLGGVAITLHPAYSPKLLMDLVGLGKLDAAVVVDYPGFEVRAGAAVRTAAVADEPIRVALWSDHPHVAAAEVRLADLADDPWVLSPSDRAGWPDYFYAACRAAGFAPHVRYEVAALHPLNQILMHRLAISPCQATFTPPPGVTVRPIAGDPMRLRHLIVWPAEGRLARHADDLLRLAREVYETSTI
jgi:DNA-binding transcriptional LysR family regulator